MSKRSTKPEPVVVALGAPAVIAPTRGEIRAAVATRRKRGEGVDPIDDMRTGELERLYRETGNGAFAVAAIADALGTGAPLPSWAEAFLSVAVERVMSSPRKDAAGALGLARGWGAVDEVAFRDVRRAGMVWALVAADWRVGEAVAVVAAREHVEHDAIKAAWRRERARFEELAALPEG